MAKSEAKEVELDFDLTEVQELQLDTGLSEVICKKLLSQEFEYTYVELFEVMAAFEKIPLSLLHPILKYVCLCVLKYNVTHPVHYTYGK